MTVIVTADHACGGVQVTERGPSGQFPGVTWRWTQHTNTRVDAFGFGPLTETLQRTIHDNTFVHALLLARVTGLPLMIQSPGLVVDGDLSDQRHVAVQQTNLSGFGDAYDRLGALTMDADAAGLWIGVEGVFEWANNTVVGLLDVDFPAATGPGGLRYALADHSVGIDDVLSSLNLLAPTAVNGFGADFAFASRGGLETRAEDLVEEAGLRGIRSPMGEPGDLYWYGMASNFGDDVRTTTGAAPHPHHGWEVHVPWSTLYPLEPLGRVPPNATVGLSVMLVNSDGGYSSSQALPPFPRGTANPGRSAVPIPGVVTFDVDPDGDGVPDGASAPLVR